MVSAYTVSIVRCEHYDLKIVEKQLREALRHVGGMSTFVKKGDRVLVKPNLLAGHPAEKNVCTHPVVMEAVLKLLLEAGAKPSVGDSPAVQKGREVAAACGILEVCNRLKVPFIELDRPVTKKADSGREFQLTKKLESFDVIVNLPKLKTHMLTVYTGAVKNLFGCIPGKIKSGFHLKCPTAEKFSDMLLDLYTVVKPQLTIMDGIIGMQGAGPSFGRPAKTGILVAGNDALAVDTVVVSAVGIERRVPLMHLARARGFAQANRSNIHLLGEKDIRIKGFSAPGFGSMIDMIRGRLMSKARSVLSGHPTVDEKLCVGCGYCSEVCASHAITIGKVARIDPRKCARCYCCYEVCPHHAITVKGLLQKFR